MLEPGWTGAVSSDRIGHAPRPATRMRLLIPVIALAVVAGYAFRGRLTHLEHLRLRWWWLVIAGLGIQFLPLPEGDAGNDLLVRTGVLAASYLLLLVFAAANVRLPGMPLILIGLLCNAVVITANGGMPVSVYALRDSGQPDVVELLIDEGADKHHRLDDDDVLTFLADVIAVPAPIRQVVSVGDLFVYAGLVWLVVAAMRARTPLSSSTSLGKHRRGAAGAAHDHRPPEPPAAATRSGSAP
jgi:Family of unknown function (DUF5317)